MLPRALVAGLHLRWDGVRQRPHHLLSRFARRVPVVVVEEPFPAREDRDEIFRPQPNLTVVRPLRRRGWSAPFVDEAAIASARALVGPGPCGVVLWTPVLERLADAFGAAPLLYDVMDELGAFAVAPPGLAEREAAVLRRADVVVCGGRTIHAARAGLRPDARCEPSGVEFDRFAAAVGPHPLPSALRGPRLGYTGVLDERIDAPLVAALADALPEMHLVLVGPVAKVDPLAFPRGPNVHLTGSVPYDALPSWLAGFDVALMPFARNAATAAISPTKTLEYLAAGVPVVSTPIADVVTEYGDVVAIAADAASFAAAVRTALVPDPQRRVRGLAHARARSWDAIAARILDAVAAA